MRLIHALTRLRHNDRGAVAVFVALGMTVFLGSAAIAIDLGHVMNVRTESQRVADLAALAGASAFVDGSAVVFQTLAEQRAIDYAARNTVNQTTVALIVADIQVDIPNERVRVTVRHQAARGNPIQTIFARVLGINTVDVVTTAVAEAYPAGGARCILPFMLPDRYLEGPPDPANDSTRWDGQPPDYYEQFFPSLNPPSPTATGYTEADKGLRIVIKPAQANQGDQPNPSWYYPIALYATGGSAYRDAIAGCVDPTIIYQIDEMVTVEPGAMLGPTKQGVNLLVATAPYHQWHVANKCVVDTEPPADPNLCIASPRLRPVAMMAPPDAPASGRKDVAIMNWAGVFVEGMEGNKVIVYFAGYSGVLPVAGGSGGSGALPKIVRLVE